MRGKRGIFVCFIGIDGSGKTTLAKLLVAALQKEGVESRYVYNGITPFISRPFTLLAQALFLRDKDFYRDYRDYSQKKRRLLQTPILSQGYQYLILLDHFLQSMLKIRLPLLRGRNIICDRYIYDTWITHLAVDMNYSREKLTLMLKRSLSLLPQPDLVFLVDVPEEIACQRKQDIPSLDYLRERRRVYLEVAQEQEMSILDGCQSLDELVTIACDEIIKYYAQHRAS
jgi:dTMP kinase